MVGVHDGIGAGRLAVSPWGITQKEEGGARMPPKILVICGPTASGKTRLAVELALRYDGEVVSADSMQIYRRMDIGTAKPTAEEMRGVPHHMLDVAEPEENFSVARYVAMASRCVDDILSRGKLPIVAGGTGLYIDSLLSGREFAAFTGKTRENLQRRAETEGIAALYEELGRIDPERAEKLHLSDEKRILRALEIFYETGKTMTQHDREDAQRPPRYEAATIALSFRERDDLRARIDRRVDEMVEAGLAEEVRTLLESGVPPECTAMQAIGYKELAGAVLGNGDLAAAADEVKLRSRQYAKRQLTWFKRSEKAKWILWDRKPDFSRAVQDSTKFLKESGLG